MHQRLSSFLVRLLRNKAGNTMVMMAMAMVPLAGLVGGAVDASRLYLAKTRLQHACDAGALAGRRQMGAGAWAADSNRARTVADRFFDVNFQQGLYGTETLTRNYVENAGKVTGTASVIVPMTLMRIFNFQQTTVDVVCDAEMRLPNTDVMFVLDTTGSMEQTLSGDTQNKIAGLRTAVLCFYEILARLDTSATCSGTGASDGVGTEVQIRFGFVPYATNVNVGELLPASHVANQWPYQTRLANFTTQVAGEVVSDEYEAYNVDGTPRSISISDCAAFGNNVQFTDQNDGNRVYTPNPSGASIDTGTGANLRRTTYSNSTADDRDWGYSGAPDNSGEFRTCRRRKIVQKVGTPRFAFTDWTYRQDTIDVSSYKLRNDVSFANDTCLNVIGDGAACTGESRISGTVPASGTYDERELATVSGQQNIDLINRRWDGCIEERDTVHQASYVPIPSGAKDLDIDSAPSLLSGTSWGPTLYRVVYPRGTGSAINVSQWQNVSQQTTMRNLIWPDYQCPTVARKVQSWPTAANFENYVNGLTTGGNTYHDIGLLWGARLLSGTGIFRADNEFTAQGGAIERHLIFMTDGETCTSVYNYASYGLEWFDRRRTGTSNPGGRCETNSDPGGSISEQVNARTLAICEAVKNKNITLWVIWFGESKPWLETRLTGCATANRFFAARTSAQLQTTFATIADQIGQLRLTN
ncbi:TadE/TadG family type IV pilus assembly protein [Sphingomonas lenta]|uniref:Pilus assembly protein TadG n=1 Tax=Sphingomonas lenta TaxID=1141887 RepID=A0A2A2SGY6_9SPHN|nr:TadE/TadG family type IV pilus assembly protein [Sphingomonas lenta]PAX08472.1 pilus assembly protein TadG [Sphingomonas lenta]